MVLRGLKDVSHVHVGAGGCVIQKAVKLKNIPNKGYGLKAFQAILAYITL